MPPIHSKTYTELKPENIIHTTRLKRLLGLLRSLKVGKQGKWADFGCSEGFILEIIRKDVVPAEWNLYGFDFMGDLLDLARQRNIANATFAKFDLNTVCSNPEIKFNVVTCFETMEHVGNYKHAVDNLVGHTAKDGWLVISVPNETGLPGLMKFLGRIALRKNPYGDFFNEKSMASYIASLLFYRNIEVFRDSHATEWSVHLGFDYRNMFQYIYRNHIQSGALRLIRKETTFFGFNQIFILQKTI